MWLVELVAKWISQKTCRHTEAIICKYGPANEYLAVSQQYYKCVSCHKDLEPLTYLSIETQES